MRILFAASLVAGVTVAGQAQATCFVNHADPAMVIVRLETRIQGYHIMFMQPGETRCSDIAGGTFKVDTTGLYEGPHIQDVAERLDKVTITGSCQAGLRTEIRREDGSVRRAATLPGPLAECK